MTDRWFYPEVIERDLRDTGLPDAIVAETLACAWEYTRCVIPQFTNVERYIAFTRIIVIGIIAEFRGSMVDVTAGGRVLGYDLDELLHTVFGGTAGARAMAREYRTFLLVTADKAGARRDSELFGRYVRALARSPRDWFRLRDCDALARFTIAAALACNDLDHVGFADEEYEILTELGDTLYDAVAFHKHRAEAETNSTFAYAGEELRQEAFRRGREVLWALDVAWADVPAHRPVVNFLRLFGGPIHMMMRRYRFTEDGLTIGLPETAQVVAQTRRNVKLWNRVGATGGAAHDERYAAALAREDELMFAGLADLLEASATPHCDRCRPRSAEGFGGVELCAGCRAAWQAYLRDLPSRAAAVFPVLKRVS